MSDHSSFITEQFKQVDSFKPQRANLKGSWSGLKEAPNSVTYWDTGVPTDVLRYIGAKSVEFPEDFVSNHVQYIISISVVKTTALIAALFSEILVWPVQ